VRTNPYESSNPKAPSKYDLQLLEKLQMEKNVRTVDIQSLKMHLRTKWDIWNWKSLKSSTMGFVDLLVFMQQTHNG
jgi:hypothetical protein